MEMKGVEEMGEAEEGGEAEVEEGGEAEKGGDLYVTHHPTANGNGQPHTQMILQYQHLLHLTQNVDHHMRLSSVVQPTNFFICCSQRN